MATSGLLLIASYSPLPDDMRILPVLPTSSEIVFSDKNKKVLLIEQGKRVEDRNCPIEKVGKCVKCKPFCNITSGFSGAGAFSDGKLSLYNAEDDDIHVGGNIHKYIGVPETKKLIDY